MKPLLVLVLGLLLLPCLSQADVGEDTASTFRGTITAIETGRDSITVQNDEGQVKMFTVSSARKDSLNVGQQVAVGYVDDYQWPLQTTSLSAASQN